MEQFIRSQVFFFYFVWGGGGSAGAGWEPTPTVKQNHRDFCFWLLLWLVLLFHCGGICVYVCVWGENKKKKIEPTNREADNIQVFGKIIFFRKFDFFGNFDFFEKKVEKI